MPVNCVGWHYCEPPFWPKDLDEQWVCPECGMTHVALDIHAAAHLSPEMKRSVAVGTLGWRGVRP